MNTLCPLLRVTLGAVVVLYLVAFEAHAAQQVTLIGCAKFDFETGTDFEHRPNVNHPIWYDLEFCAGNENEYLRAMQGVSWAESPTSNFALGPNYMMEAQYASRKHPLSGYPELFYHWAGSSDSFIGKVYWIKTAEGNLVKMRIKNFVPYQKQRGIIRDMIIEYVIYFGHYR